MYFENFVNSKVMEIVIQNGDLVHLEWLKIGLMAGQDRIFWESEWNCRVWNNSSKSFAKAIENPFW